MLEKLLDIAIEQDASDLHLVQGIKPYLRVKRELIELSDLDVLKPQDTEEIFKTIIKNDPYKIKYFEQARKLDTSYKHKDINSYTVYGR